MAAPTKIRFAGWSSPFVTGGHNRGDWESGENWRGGGRKREKKSRILIQNPCSLTSRGNEVENRTLLGSTHLFFTFQEDTNVGFRALLRFPDISNVSESRSGFSRQPSARKLYQTANEKRPFTEPRFRPREKGRTRIEDRILRESTFLEENVIILLARDVHINLRKLAIRLNDMRIFSINKINLLRIFLIK